MEVEISIDRSSTEETAHMHDQQSQGNEAQGAMIMDLSTATRKGQNNLGIGVTVRTTSGTKIAEWKLKERSLGNQSLDDALALKLVLCKAAQYQWSRIRLNFANKEMLKQLTKTQPLGSRMATLLEDIVNVKRLFCMCSFCLSREENMLDSRKLSVDALGIIVDKERNVPQCL